MDILGVKEICNDKKAFGLVEEEKSLGELLNELDELVGLKKVKAAVNDLIAYQKVQKLREKEGLFSSKSTLHLAFAEIWNRENNGCSYCLVVI